MHIEIDYDHGPSDAEALQELYVQQSWWDDRTVAETRDALEGSDEAVGARLPDGTLVGSARVLTDYTIYARIYDLIVDEEHRGRGIGHRLVDAVVEHPSLADVHAIELGCFEDLVSFYEECGFEDNGPAFRTMVHQ